MIRILLVALTFVNPSELLAQGPHHPIIAFDCEPRLPNGRVDLKAISTAVRSARLDGYDYMIWHQPQDWEESIRFADLLDSLKLTTWFTLAPPTEQHPPHGRATLPFATDFVSWQRFFSALARNHPHVQALVIDDFDYNLLFFTDSLLTQMKTVRDSALGRPRLLAIIYKRTVRNFSSWWPRYGKYLDGVIYAYENYDSPDSLSNMLVTLRRALPASAILGVNIYVLGGPRAPTFRRTPQYVRTTIAISDSLADAVRLYCLPVDTTDVLFQETADYARLRAGAALNRP